jgi:flagellar biosynthetic protein FliP
MLKYWKHLKNNNHIVAIVSIFFVFFIPHTLFSQVPAGLNIDIGSFVSPEGFSSSINLLLALSSISLIPFFLVSTTAFLRIVIVLSLLRQALATQQSPPNSVIIALTLFLTIFVMTPTWNIINTVAVKPYQANEINQKQAFEKGTLIFKKHMLKFTREKDLALFLEFSKVERPKDYNDIPIFVVIPAYIISELKAAFQIAFVLFIPFLVIDLIISNILLSLGMFMLSPAMVSLPFKILLFVLTDGWNLIIRGLMLSVQ